MWELRNIERRPAELDFSSAGQGRRKVSQLIVNSIVVANAVELTDWEDDIQLIVCASCGIIHCEPGGWGSLRRAGDLIVLGPDRRMFDGDESDPQEYRPPDYVRTLGWPYMSQATYVALQGSIPELPDVDRLRPLEQREVVAILQWEAVARVLGRPFEHPTIRSDRLVDCAAGDISIESDKLCRFIETWCGARAGVRLEPCRPGVIQVKFHVGICGTPTWWPLVRRDEEPAFRLEPGLIAVLDEATPIEIR